MPKGYVRMSRTKLREKIFQLLFGVEFSKKEDFHEQMQRFFDSEEQQLVSEEDKAYILQKVDQIIDHMEEIDKMIDEKAVGWELSRIGKVELAIFRLAAYEILWDEAVPDSVAINEAVDLAKKYASQESPAFINAVLAKFVPKKAE